MPDTGNFQFKFPAIMQKICLVCHWHKGGPISTPDTLSSIGDFCAIHYGSMLCLQEIFASVEWDPFKHMQCHNMECQKNDKYGNQLANYLYQFKFFLPGQSTCKHLFARALPYESQVAFSFLLHSFRLFHCIISAAVYIQSMLL